MIKTSRFLVLKNTYSLEDYTRLYIKEIMSLHGVPLSFILDRGPQFVSHLWKSFQKGLGTQVNLSTTFHPHTDGQEAYYSDPRGYVESLCDRFQGKLG